MISIDTNVLLRYLLQDDKSQSDKANKIFAGKHKVLITDIVLVETMWTLKGKKYKLSKEEMLSVLDALFKESNIIFEDGQTVWRAFNHVRESNFVKVKSKKKDIDFADALILEKSKYVCHQKNEAFEHLYSFDIAAQQIDVLKNRN